MNIFLALLLISVLIIPVWLLLGGEDRRGSGSSPQGGPLQRRRSDDLLNEIDHEIEQEAREKAHKRRRSDNEENEFVKIDDDFSIPNNAESIIPEDSPFSLYSRALSNVDNYVNRGDFDNAVSLYEGIKNRISDPDIRNRIDQNIDYLNNYEQVATSKAEELKKRRMEESEIKLSLTGGGINDKIQINMAPAEIDIESIAEKVKNRMGGASPYTGNSEINSLRSQVSSLKDELISLNREKEQLKTEKSGELSNRLDEIQDLRNAVDRLSQEKDNADEISRIIKEFGENVARTKDAEIEQLKRDISEIKSERIIEKLTSSREAQTDEIAGEISKLQNELERLSDERRHANDIDKKLDNLLSREYAPSAPGTPDSEKDELKNEIAKLKSSLDDISKQARKGDEFSPGMFETAKDNKDEFETLQDLVHGPKYDQPTDDEIMAQILKSAAEENREKFGEKKRSSDETPTEKKDEKEEVEIRGPKGEQAFDLDIDKFLFSQNEKQQQDEQFYSSFMDRNAPKRKELPILSVSYSFDKLPDRNTLSREQNVLEFSFYKYKPLLEKANDFIKRRRVKDALNYYKVILDQNIPEEFKSMVRRNVADLNEYLQKYMNS